MSEQHDVAASEPGNAPEADALRTIGNGYEVRHVGKPWGMWIRAGVLAVGFGVTTAGAMMMSGRIEAAIEGGGVMVLPAAIVIGLLFAVGLIVSPEVRASNERATLERRIKQTASASRDEPIGALLEIEPDHPLYGIASALHDVLMDGHRDRLEAARLRRDMDWRVDQKTKKATIRYAKEAETDELTGLLNRRGFARRLDEMIEASRQTNGMSDLALLAIDLDRFKLLNDTHGHDKGDEALAAVGEVLLAHTRDSDCAARLGGDEFVMVLLPGTATSGKQVGERLIKLFATHGASSGVGELWPSISVGIAALHGDNAPNAEALCRWADEALYASKRGGRAMCLTYAESRRGGRRVA